VGLRQLITGFLFGATGASIALSVVGKESRSAYQSGRDDGVSGCFASSMDGPRCIYVLGQLAGGIIGFSTPPGLWLEGSERRFWRHLARRRLLDSGCLVGEIVTTFTMVSLLVVFIGFRRLRRFTPVFFRLCMRSWSIWKLDFWHQHEPRPAASGRRSFRGNGKDGGLLGRSVDRCFTGIPGLQPSREANHVAKLYYFDSDRDGCFARMSRDGGHSL